MTDTDEAARASLGELAIVKAIKSTDSERAVALMRSYATTRARAAAEEMRRQAVQARDALNAPAVPARVPQLCQCELSGFVHVVSDDSHCELCEPDGRQDITAESVGAALKFMAGLIEKTARVPEGFNPTHRHYKGGLYRKLYEATWEAHMLPVVVYQNEAGRVWVRATSEFDGNIDGVPRFALLAAAPPQPEPVKGET